MPPGYHFGITAASAETPDSFETYKLMVTTSQTTREEPGRVQPPPDQQQYINPNPPPQDIPAAQIPNNDAQFEDLHNRLQSLAHSIDNLFYEVKALGEKSESRHNEINRRSVSSTDRINAMDVKIQGIERIEKTVREYQSQFSTLQNLLKDSHSSLAESLPRHMGDRKCLIIPRRCDRL